MKKFIMSTTVVKASFIALLAIVVFYGCTKDNNKDGSVRNSLTLFKLDNKNNDVDLMATDTVVSMAGVNGKYIPVSGATGAENGLDSITLELYTTDNVLLNSVTVKSFYKPNYHVLNAQLVIPPAQRGKVYKVVVKVVDKSGAIVGTKTFFGMDVVSCDPLPPCVVNNQITVLVETPAGTPDETISLFGSLNGWNRGDLTFKLNKNPEVPNCYCVSLPYPPGSGAWQLGEIFVVRGAAWEKQAVKADGSDFIVQYGSSDMGPIWKIKVPKWRDQ